MNSTQLEEEVLRASHRIACECGSQKPFQNQQKIFGAITVERTDYGGCLEKAKIRCDMECAVCHAIHRLYHDYISSKPRNS